MRLLAGFLAVFLLVALSHANVLPRRTYRNTEEILVPVTIIQDGEEIKETVNLKENDKDTEFKSLQPEVIAENVIAAAIEAEENLEAVQAAVQAQRRIDEAIVEEEINEAIKEEEEVKEKELENKLKTTLAEVPQAVSTKEPIEKAEEIPGLKSAAIVEQSPKQVVVIEEDNGNANNVNDDLQQPENAVRQATQATPTQTTTQQNFVQQLIQNSPLGQFLNQITGQTTQTQLTTDDTAAAPGLFNPVTAVQNAAQSVVNTTTQAFQGLQQFASSLGNQFQNTLSGLGGQPAVQGTNDATTARPPGPIQQLVNTFIPQPAQPANTQGQGPLQGLLNIFQGNTRPQQAATGATDTAIPSAQPTKATENQEETQAAAAAETTDPESNEVRDSGEANDSFEESVQPEELIIVNDDATQTEGNIEPDVTNN